MSIKQESKIMYGLFEYTYDYYEWEKLIAVSEHKFMLVELARTESNYDLVDYEKNKELAGVGTCHSLIKEVRYIKENG